jgi:hypothetical protein
MTTGCTRCLPRSTTTLLLAAVAAALASCTNESATGLGDSFLPLKPQTVEVRLPWSEFGAGVEVIGGYGLVSETPAVVVAEDYQGAVDARALASFTYPTEITLADTTGVQRVDSTFSPVQGRLLVRFDTLGLEGFQMVAGLLLDEWDQRTATWEAAVDSVGEYREWSEPGAGPVTVVGRANWLRGSGDSLIVTIDSTGVATLADTSQASGLRIGLETPDRLVSLLELGLEVSVRSTVNPDTLVTLTPTAENVTFIYSPSPPAPSEGLRVGGVPAWRTVMRLNVPTALDGPPELCAVVTCPFQIDASRLHLASISLTPTVPEPGFRPTHTLEVDARGLLAPELQPKSPLGFSLAFGGVSVPPDVFDGVGGKVEIPVTTFVADLIRGTTSAGAEPLQSLAIIDLLEPRSFPYATFAGPGQEGEPVLRMIVTTADTVEIR